MWSFFFFKQKTAYEMRISDWSSDVCSSDLFLDEDFRGAGAGGDADRGNAVELAPVDIGGALYQQGAGAAGAAGDFDQPQRVRRIRRSEERRVGKECFRKFRSRRVLFQ